MFPELQCTEKLEILLRNIQQNLAKNDSPDEVKKCLDKLEEYAKNAPLCDKNCIEQPIFILKDKLIVKAYSLVAQDYPSLQDRYNALFPVHKNLLATDFSHPSHRGLLSHLYNRFYILEARLHFQKR